MDTRIREENVRYRAVVELLRTAEAIWNASRLFFDQWDLSPSQFNVLNLLRLSPDGLSQSDLSRELIMHRSNVTGLVDRLEKQRLVKRRDVEEDRRVYRVVLTPEGAALLDKILPSYFDGAERVWEGVPDGQVQEITGVMQTVATNAERVSTAPR